MKACFQLLFALAALFASGCTTNTQSHAADLLGKAVHANVTLANVSQSTTTPWYNHTESLTGLHKDAKTFSVEDLKAQFNIPFPILNIPLLHWEFNASAITGTLESQEQVQALLAPTGK